MLDYLCLLVLGSPLRVLIATLTAAIVGGSLGWWSVSRRAHAAWRRVAARTGTNGPGAYRAPLRTMSIERTPFLVSATAFTSHALYPGHAAFVVVFIEEASRGRAVLAMMALCLAVTGGALAHGTHAVVTRGLAALPTMRRRVVMTTTCVLLVNGAVALVLVAVLMGAVDSFSFETRGLKGIIETMSLGELVRRQPLFVSIGGHCFFVWQAIGLGALAYACGSIVHAALALVLATTPHGLSTGASAGAIPPSEAPSLPAATPAPPQSTPTLPARPPSAWSGCLVAIATAITLCGATCVGSKLWHGRASTIYPSIQGACSLPGLPDGAADLAGDQTIDLMSESASVQFRAPDPARYVAGLLAAGYSDVKAQGGTGSMGRPRKTRGDAPESVEHYELLKTFGREPGVITAHTKCSVSVDRRSGMVRIGMWAGD